MSKDNRNNSRPGLLSNLLRPFRIGAFRFVRVVIGWIMIIIVCLWVVSGSINQKEVGKMLIDKITAIGQIIGLKIESAASGDLPLDLEITPDGVYKKGATPPNDASIGPLIPNVDKSNQTKEKNSKPDKSENKEKKDKDKKDKGKKDKDNNKKEKKDKRKDSNE